MSILRQISLIASVSAVAAMTISSSLSAQKSAREINQFRYTSTIIRDHMPFPDEAKEFYNGQKTLDTFISEWLQSPSHITRVERFFHDIFGHEKYFFLQPDATMLRLSSFSGSTPTSEYMPSDLASSEESDVYYLPSFTKSACQHPDSGNLFENISVWWSSVPVKMCTSAISQGGMNTNFLEIDSDDMVLTFADDNGSHTATLAITPPMRYHDWQALADAVESAMESASAGMDFEVTWDISDRRFVLSALNSAVFNIPAAAGNATMLDKLGFKWWENLVGSTSYTAPIASWYQEKCSEDMGRHDDCGCGDEAFLCFPYDSLGTTLASISDEFKHRASYYYQTESNWINVFGGDKFFGNRFLYHHYLFQGDFYASSQNPPQSVLDALKALPLDTRVETTMPDFTLQGTSAGNGPQRSGVATAPGFLRRFNNLRARIRALTERLLCKDIDATLNIDNYQTFNNPNFYSGAANNVFDHGSKETCSTCHYSLDNFAATILLWADNGEGIYSAQWPYEYRSQLGHVFGQDGTGPRFLMQQYLSQNEFTQCMAKTAWEDFTGIKWSQLNAAEQSSIQQLASNGPHSLITGVLSSNLVTKIRNPDPIVSSETVTVSYDYDDDVLPILQEKCLPCHGSSGAQSFYVGNAAEFKKASTQRITDGSMPPGALPALSNQEASILVNWINQ